MLDTEKVRDILLNISTTNEIGCTYDVNERFGVGLSPLEILGLVKIIRTRIPTCGDHCPKYNDCEWIALFEKRKSKSKFKLTKDGLRLLGEMSSEGISNEKIVELLQSYLMGNSTIDLILSMLIDTEFLTIEKLTSNLLKESNLKLQVIRSTIKDILDLMVSLNLISIIEGQITKMLQE